jgi:hypothetical protein
VQSPQLNIADKLILPPSYITRYVKEDQVPEHQFQFFSSTGIEKENLRQELASFGEQLKRRIQNSPFYWKGFGTLRYSSSEVSFQPDEFRSEALQPIRAERVLRENVQHQVLVGDQEMTSQQVTEALKPVEDDRPWFIMAGWTLFILSVIVIIIILYMKNFQTTSTGLQTRW